MTKVAKDQVTFYETHWNDVDAYRKYIQATVGSSSSSRAVPKSSEKLYTNPLNQVVMNVLTEWVPELFCKYGIYTDASQETCLAVSFRGPAKRLDKAKRRKPLFEDKFNQEVTNHSDIGGQTWSIFIPMDIFLVNRKNYARKQEEHEQALNEAFKSS